MSAKDNIRKNSAQWGGPRSAIPRALRLVAVLTCCVSGGMDWPSAIEGIAVCICLSLQQRDKEHKMRLARHEEFRARRRGKGEKWPKRKIQSKTCSK
jgi:hypothetical protein